MATRGPGLVCEACGEYVRVYTLQEPTLASFGGGLSDTEDVEIPAYKDVVAADGGVEAND